MRRTTEEHDRPTELRKPLGNLLREVSRACRCDASDANADRRAAFTRVAASAVEVAAIVAGKPLASSAVEHYATQIVGGDHDEYESVACNLGLIDETRDQRFQRELRELVIQIETAIGTVRAEGRSHVSELLEPYDINTHPELGRLMALTDAVAMNETPWNEYARKVRQEIYELRHRHLIDLL